MAIREAIILAGGLGTRLRSVVPNLPKCMAFVNSKPFLTYVINHLLAQGVDRFIFSLGYKSEAIIDFLEKAFPSLSYKVVVEDEPLGTGGAIKKACSATESSSVLVTNGDTLFTIEVKSVADLHESYNVHCTLSLKPMKNFDRYGVVEIDGNHVIKSFREKQHYDSGLINGGMYILNVNNFLKEDLPEKFSFEKDYLEQFFNQRKMLGIEQDQYFIDIGIPQDYARAQLELK
jgi:D-glycero-alpha-D-manno-heptose 1-phosphate guanylyltransferase